MRFESEQTRLIRESAADFVRRAEPLKHLRAARQQGSGFSAHLLELMREAGWFGLLVDEPHGGVGADYADVAALCEELGRGLAEAPILIEAVLAASLLLRSPDSVLRSQLLAELADGRLPCALAIGAGSGLGGDWRLASFEAHREAGSWVLRGCSSRLRFTAEPKGFVVSARSAEGTLLGWLPAGAAQIQLRKQWLVDGSAAYDLTLEGITLQSSQVLAIGAPAGQALDHALDVGAVMVSAALLGLSEAAATLCRNYLCTRVQFGKPIGSFQSLAHRAVDQYIELQLAQDSLANAVGALSVTQPGDRERVKAVARAKSRCSDTAMKITRESIQMHGAIAFTDEYDAGLFLKRALVQSAWLGSGTQHRRRYAEREFQGIR
jgi:alkylation response protein AidB-like acyl-CoA dehydrogenase